MIPPASRIDTAKNKLLEIHNDPIWCKESVFCGMVLFSAEVCMGHKRGNSIKSMRHTSALFLIYLRTITSAAVKPALADVWALSNLYNWSWCGGRCWYSWVFWHVWHFMYGVYCSVFHSHPLNSARFLPEMHLLVFIFGVYESAYWMNDLLVFMQIMI